MGTEYDRTTEDLGNIVALEHVNTRIPDQQMATIFYISGMGFTRDPFLTVGVDNMWINIGKNQIHMPTSKAEVLRGHVGIVLPNRESLLGRLARVKDALADTQFAVVEHDGYVDVTSPWGNRLRCFEPDPAFGSIDLGMPYVEFDVPVGTAEPIARFYREVFLTQTSTATDAHGSFATCSVGHHQAFIFRETERPIPEYDGHHVQIYLANFSTPYRKLREHGLITEESAQTQYRFQDIIDLDSGEIMYTVEHEVRSMTNPLYGRPLLNRNAELGGMNFAQGHEARPWTSFVSV